MSVLADVNITIKVTDQPEIVGSSSPSVVYDEYCTRETLSGTSDVSIDAVTAFLAALTAGAATIDLTDVAGTTGDQSMSGKSLRTIYLQATSDNAGVISIQAGATNGYPLFGSSGKITLSPGDSMGLRISTTNDVDGTHKTIDLAGTGDDSLVIVMTFG